MNTQITLDHIKAILFRAASLNDALAQLDSLGVSYRGETAYVIDAFGVTFWPARTRLSGNRPLFVMVDSENVRDTTEEHLAVLAQLQGSELVTEVPAATFPVAAEHPFCKVDSACSYRNCSATCPVITKQFTASVDNRKSMLYGFRLEFARTLLRNERRLKSSQAEGYQL